jgi:hypothetical protein
MLAACGDFSVLEDVGDDPHPPQLELLGVAYEPVEPATVEPKTSLSTGRAATPDIKPAEGFVVRPYDEGASSLLFRVRYFDAGGDLESIIITDLDGTLKNQGLNKIPVVVDLDGDGEPDTQPDLVYYSGTSGTVDLGYLSFPPGVEGPHRMQLWAEDGHGSRSAKLAFIFTVLN